MRVVLGLRDEALLRGLARFRAAATSHLVRVYFPDVRKDTASDRLRRLYDGEVLSLVAAPMNGENVYCVGPAGARWLEDRGVACGIVPRPPLDHHLGLVGAWTKLAAGLHGSATTRLVRFTPDWEWRKERAGTGTLIVPDAAATLSVGGGGAPPSTVRLFLEVDLGTERHGALMHKFAAYDAEGLSDQAGLAVILPDRVERRAASLQLLVEQRWRSWAVVCSQSEWPAALLSRLAELADPPLGPSPDGKGRSAALTSSGPTWPGGQGEVPSR